MMIHGPVGPGSGLDVMVPRVANIVKEPFPYSNCRFDGACSIFVIIKIVAANEG